MAGPPTGESLIASCVTLDPPKFLVICVMWSLLLTGCMKWFHRTVANFAARPTFNSSS